MEGSNALGGQDGGIHLTTFLLSCILIASQPTQSFFAKLLDTVYYPSPSASLRHPIETRSQVDLLLSRTASYFPSQSAVVLLPRQWKTSPSCLGSRIEIRPFAALPLVLVLVSLY